MIYPNSKRFFPIYKNNSGPQPGPDYSTMPLTFRSTGDTAIQINKTNLSYSKNGGVWQSYDLSYIPMSDGDEVSFSGTNTSVANNFVTSGNGTLEVFGNPHSLINNGPLTVGGAFYTLFKNCVNIVGANNLALTALTLKGNDYNSMFYGCSSLSSAPELPATTLGIACYEYMFYGCTNLVNAPYLPATKLADGCYASMFQNCSKLSSVNVAFTDWGNEFGLLTQSWLKNTASEGVFYKPSNLTPFKGDNYIPQDWDVVNKTEGDD